MNERGQPYHSLERHVSQSPRQSFPRHGESGRQGYVSKQIEESEPHEAERPTVADLAHLFRVLQVKVALVEMRKKAFADNWMDSVDALFGKVSIFLKVKLVVEVSRCGSRDETALYRWYLVCVCHPIRLDVDGTCLFGVRVGHTSWGYTGGYAAQEVFPLHLSAMLSPLLRSRKRRTRSSFSSILGSNYVFTRVYLFPHVFGHAMIETRQRMWMRIGQRSLFQTPEICWVMQMNYRAYQGGHYLIVQSELPQTVEDAPRT